MKVHLIYTSSLLKHWLVLSTQQKTGECRRPGLGEGGGGGGGRKSSGHLPMDIVYVERVFLKRGTVSEELLYFRYFNQRKFILVDPVHTTLFIRCYPSQISTGQMAMKSESRFADKKKLFSNLN